uniref:Uncharacterized protein n=1 Tax=Cacopsylla melanoneura TaxID=428564 RepID=A0A8D8YEP0_9HEMI
MGLLYKFKFLQKNRSCYNRSSQLSPAVTAGRGYNVPEKVIWQHFPIAHVLSSTEERTYYEIHTIPCICMHLAEEQVSTSHQRYGIFKELSPPRGTHMFVCN